MKAHEFDRAFDAGEDAGGHLDRARARRVNAGTRRIDVAFPAWVVAALDRRANAPGVPRRALIERWIVERLKETT